MPISYGAPCQLVTGGIIKRDGLSPKQAQAVEVLNNHFSLPDVEAGRSV